MTPPADLAAADRSRRRVRRHGAETSGAADRRLSDGLLRRCVVAILLAPAALALFAYGSGLIMRSKSLAAGRRQARGAGRRRSRSTTRTTTKACWRSARSCICGCRSSRSCAARSPTTATAGAARFERDDDFAPAIAAATNGSCGRAAKRSAGTGQAAPRAWIRRRRAGRADLRRRRRRPRHLRRDARRSAAAGAGAEFPLAGRRRASPARRRARSPARACSARRRPR